jgi:hypothetical protein
LNEKKSLHTGGNANVDGDNVKKEEDEALFFHSAGVSNPAVGSLHIFSVAKFSKSTGKTFFPPQSQPDILRFE